MKTLEGGWMKRSLRVTILLFLLVLVPSFHLMAECPNDLVGTLLDTGNRKPSLLEGKCGGEEKVWESTKNGVQLITIGDKGLGNIYYLYIALTIIMLLIIAGILLSGTGFRKSNLYLALILFMLTINTQSIFFIKFHPDIYMYYLIGTGYGAIWWLGPLCLLFVWANTSMSITLKKIRWHLVIPGLYSIVNIIYWFLPAEFRENFGRQRVEYENIFFSIMDPVIYLYLYFYLIYALIIIYRRSKRKPGMEKRVEIHRRRVACMIIYGFILYGVGAIPMAMVQNGKLYDHYIITYTVLLSFFVAVFNAFKNPSFFTANVLDTKKKEERVVDECQENHSGDHEEIKKCLDRAMETEEPFLDPNITIERLAKMIGTNKRKLTAIIRCSYGCSFIDYINQKRVEKAKNLLAEDKGKKFTVEFVAGKSGFQNRSTFYNVFKKYVDSPPAAYRDYITRGT